MNIGFRAKLFFISVGLIAVAVVVAYTYLRASLERTLHAQIRDDLFVKLELVERAAGQSDAPLVPGAKWDALADELGERSRGRISLLRHDGVLLGDSALSEQEVLAAENHAGRPEIRGALSGQRSTSTRFSSTVSREMMYAAVPLQHGGRIVGVARMAVPVTAVEDSVRGLTEIVSIASLLGLAIAIAMSTIAAQLASRDMRELTVAARRMAEGDLQTRTNAVGRDEFAELGRTLDQLAGSLSSTLEQLRAERDRLSGILNGMREGVLLLDKGGRVALVNPALREMLFVGGDAVGKLPLEVVRHEQLKRLLDGVADSGRADSAELEIGGMKPRRLLVHAAALKGEPGGSLAVFFDVTNLRKLESLRRDFVANVSHELRTPITAIRSAAETLMGGAGEAQKPREQFLGMIERNASRLQDLVEDLLDLSKIESNELHLESKPVALAPLGDRIAQLFEDRVASKHIELVMDLEHDVSVRADTRALEQVVANLIDNAIKYCPERSRIGVDARADGEIVQLRVTDDGPGIGEDHLPRLFERFYRVDPGRSRDLGGTGLGLAIVKHLVEAMGGSIAVNSKPGAGTSFTITLPKA